MVEILFGNSVFCLKVLNNYIDAGYHNLINRTYHNVLTNICQYVF
jgi:hypothetical protein